MQIAFELGKVKLEPGTKDIVLIPFSQLADLTDMMLKALVIHGKKPGPRMFVSGAIHGDEIIGAEIVRRVSRMKMLLYEGGEALRFNETAIRIGVKGILGDNEQSVIATYSGVIIGRTNLPIVNQGDALFHIARFDDLEDAETTIETRAVSADKDPLFDGIEIV